MIPTRGAALIAPRFGPPPNPPSSRPARSATLRSKKRHMPDTAVRHNRRMPAALVAVLASSALFCVLAFALMPRGRAPRIPQTNEAHVQDHDTDETFVFEVLERVLARTVDGNRYLDALFLGVLASDVALIVLVVEKATAYRDYLLAGTATIAATVSAALLLSILVRETPEPKRFLREATSDVRRARFEQTQRFVIFSQRNDWLRAAKMSIFVFALVVLLTAALVTSVGTMLESKGKHEALETPQPSHLPPPASGGGRWRPQPRGTR
jgi:hypothetical protein